MAYVTLANVRQHGGYKSTELGHDDEIDELIPRAESAIESYTNNVFNLGGTTTRYFDALEDVEGQKLYFDEWLASTTSLVITNGDGNTVASSEYVTLPRNGTPIYGLQLKSSSTVAWDYTTSPENAISIVGYWGFSENPPEDIKLACIQLVLHWLRLEDQSEDKVIPSDICMMLKPYTQRVGWL
jgi:hypothetical protein